MAIGKRGREPGEAPQHTNKYHRVQKEPQTPDLVPRQHPRNNIGEELSMPAPSFSPLSQTGSHHSPLVQLPPEQPDPGAIPRQPLTISALKPQSQVGPMDPGSSHSETSTCYSQYVATYDVGRDVEAVGIPDYRDMENWGSHKGAAEFIRSESGIETNWVGIRPLGKGGYGMAGLWEMRDDDGQLTKQMVIKEETHTRTQWRENKFRRRVPGEVKIMSKLNKTHCHAIPRLFSYKRYPHVYKHRIYMEYCPFNDLSVLCKRYRRFRQFLPEPFLWDTFYHMVEAAVAMRDSSKGSIGELEIVHRDLKPGNVFLGEENAEKGFPFYPVAKTGDFGMAVMTRASDPSNPQGYQGAGTKGYLAPEQRRDDTTEKAKQNRLSSYTNVWAIGATMLELLTLYPHADYMNDPDFNVYGTIIDIQTQKTPEYSKSLRDLIKGCIEFEPLDRIELDRLRACIKFYRDRLNNTYEQSDNTERARFESNSLLYYVRNEINNMPTGRWEPYEPESPSKPEDEKFPNLDWPVVFPRFDDGPEATGEENDDSDSDDHSDDDDLPSWLLPARKPTAPEGTPSNNTSPRLFFGLPPHQPPRVPVAKPIADIVHPSKGRHLNNPIVIADDTVKKQPDTSDTWPRTRQQSPFQLYEEGEGSEISDSEGAGDGSLRNEGRPSNGKSSNAGAWGAAREDGGIEGLEGSLTDGLPDEGALDEGTDDESLDMDLESDDPVSPPPPGLQAPTHHAPAPAPAPQVPAPQVPAPPVPAPQAPAAAPAAPAPAAHPTRIPRKLRNGTVFGYF